MPLAGGMLRVGIPDYQLPKAVLDYEIERILSLGVELELETAVEDLDALFRQGYRAVFLALGAHRGLTLQVEGAELAAVSTGVDFLRSVSLGERKRVGKSVLVVGGGNVAIDVARTALRLGAPSVALTCLESRDSMPAHAWEIEAAEAEGITIYPDCAVGAILRRGEEISGAECLEVTYMAFDEDGNLSLETRPNSDHLLPCETVIFAIGQVPDIDSLRMSDDVLLNSQGFISVDPTTLMTTRPGVFAGGDVIPGSATAAEALGSGKRAALNIDAFLNGQPLATQQEVAVASYEEMNHFYYQPIQRNEIPQAPPSQRIGDFREVNSPTYDPTTARAEARRCLSCGNCSECDNCWIFCPDMAVLKLQGPDRYRVEYSYCKGCGICAQECPCGVMEMIPEDTALENS
jgi:2-oxoacid:acceptor oxidoreductase delta subunit (pyruvate/2-ketoisovalerate family)